jgi:SOS-response transcriptional repressor LexA
MRHEAIQKHEPAIKHRALGYRAVQVLRFVRLHIEENGYAPSYGAIRDELGFLDKSDVCKIVNSLERRGLLMRVGKGKVRRGDMWNKPVLALVIDAAIPVKD